MTTIPVVYVKGQYNHLIVRNLRELGVNSKLLPPSHQLLATAFGGVTEAARKPEFGPVEISVLDDGRILEGLGPSFTAWESHNDEVVRKPDGFQVIAKSSNCSVEAMRHEKRDIFGVQFHPEVSHTTKGVDLFKNFLGIVEEHKRT